jgi:hypothetical protein
MKKIGFSFKVSLLLTVLIIWGILAINYAVVSLPGNKTVSKANERMTIIGIDYRSGEIQTENP